MNTRNLKPMSPYIAGALTGIASVLALTFQDNLFGSLEPYIKFAKYVYYLINRESMLDFDRNAQLAVYLKQSWQAYFVPGIFIGALIGAVLGGDFKFTHVPKLWRERFGPSPVKRGIAAFAGGFIAIVGAVIVGGCPSGVGMSGMIVLSLGAFVAFGAFFAGGAITSRLLYGSGRKGGDG